MEASSTARAPRRTPRPGKYLAFFLADEQYAVEILKVREIMGLLPVTRLPGTPPFVRGVINLRGSVVPVADLREYLGMPCVEPTRETCVLVLQLGERAFGVIVDRVTEVLDLAAQDFSDVPELGSGPAPGDGPEHLPHHLSDHLSDHLLGLARANDRVTILLDPDCILRSHGRAIQASVATDR